MGKMVFATKYRYRLRLLLATAQKTMHTQELCLLLKRLVRIFDALYESFSLDARIELIESLEGYVPFIF